MSGSIVRALNWSEDHEQQFIAVNPIGDEVILYQTHHEDSKTECNDIVKLNSCTGFENISCSSYSPVLRGYTAVGSIDGRVSIFDINSPNSSVLRLTPKQSRPCNAISFNNKNYIAAAFDKGRQDNSLQIWNIEHYSSNGKNDHIRRPVSTYLPNEAILSSTFYPEKENSLLCGSYKFLREMDLRMDSPVFQIATKCTLDISIDPFQDNMFTSSSEDGSFAVWDRRKLSSNTVKSRSSSNSNFITETPVLLFNKLLTDSMSRKNYNPCVRHSTIRKGEFAVAFNGSLIRRWNTGQVPPTHQSSKDSKPSHPTDGDIVQSLKYQSSQLYKQNEDSLFVSIVLDVKTDFERVISFDYSPHMNSPTSTYFVCMRQSGSVFRMPVVECIESLDFNSYNEFTFAGPEGVATKFLNDEAENQLATTANKVHDLSLARDSIDHGNNEYGEDIESMVDEDSVLSTYENDLHIGNGYNDEYSIPLGHFINVSEMIMNDICGLIRKRASLGYSVDSERNIQILESTDASGNWLSLRNTWKWINLAKKSLDKGTMISDGIDLGYQGVLGIWKGIEELDHQFNSDSISLTNEKFAQAVKSIVTSKGKKTANISIPSNSDRKEQRKLCLIVSGWYLNDDEFDEKLNTLISLGFIEKAAGWAVFHGDVSRAIEILASSKKERLRLISTAVAGYLAYRNSNVNSPWKDQCRKMASDLDDPYLRATFAFIADNDWWDVLDEHALPLRERLGVALRFLSDRDLTVYLNRIADSVVVRGELEGLILTGITPRGISLLQSYVDRTSDVQTASIIAAFGCPRYFTDARVDHWTHCYRNLLNGWELFSVRAKFDVARSKLSKDMSGVQTLKPAPKQVYLQCIRCNKNIAKPPTSRPKYGMKAMSSSNGAGTVVNNSSLLKQFNKQTAPTKQSFEVKACPHCSAPLPRCSICLLTLGTSIPSDTSGRSTDSSLVSRIENRFKDWFSFCLTCNHGAHAYHAEEWFSKHYVCPVPDCNCRCNSI